MKTYELPPSESNTSKEPNALEKSVKAMGSWAGRSSRPEESSRPGPSVPTADNRGAVRQGLKRMGTWGFKGAHTETEDKDRDNEDEDEDDRHIRFTIGGKGRRLTKEDFLKEIQSLDPKARCEVINESDAPLAMKTMAKKDASDDSPGDNRLYGASDVQPAMSSATAKTVGARMAKIRGARVDPADDEDTSSGSSRERPSRKREAPLARRQFSGGLTNVESSSGMEESAAERKRREAALQGVDDGRGRSRDRSGSRSQSRGSAEIEETPAERRRRLAVLGSFRGGNTEDDSDDDDTPRVPPPVAKSRGIRFAQSPERGRK